jgi:hypothetical protein
MRLRISEFCKARHVTRIDGAHLRREIQQRWHQDDQLVLDFSGVRIASVSFFDESLGLLAREHDLEDLKRRVKVENMDPADRALLNSIVVARSRERKQAEQPGTG